MDTKWSVTINRKEQLCSKAELLYLYMNKKINADTPIIQEDTKNPSLLSSSLSAPFRFELSKEDLTELLYLEKLEQKEHHSYFNLNLKSYYTKLSKFAFVNIEDLQRAMIENMLETDSFIHRPDNLSKVDFDLEIRYDTWAIGKDVRAYTQRLQKTKSIRLKKYFRNIVFKSFTIGLSLLLLIIVFKGYTFFFGHIPDFFIHEKCYNIKSYAKDNDGNEYSLALSEDNKLVLQETNLEDENQQWYVIKTDKDTFYLLNKEKLVALTHEYDGEWKSGDYKNKPVFGKELKELKELIDKNENKGWSFIHQGIYTFAIDSNCKDNKDYISKVVLDISKNDPPENNRSVQLYTGIEEEVKDSDSFYLQFLSIFYKKKDPQQLWRFIPIN